MTEPTPPKYRIRVCDGPSCGVTYESERLVELLEATIDRDEALKARAGVCTYMCFGRCDEGPNMFVHELQPGDDPDDEPDPEVLETQRGFYPGMDEKKVIRVLQDHCGNDCVVEDLVDTY